MTVHDNKIPRITINDSLVTSFIFSNGIRAFKSNLQVSRHDREATQKAQQQIHYGKHQLTESTNLRSCVHQAKSDKCTMERKRRTKTRPTALVVHETTPAILSDGMGRWHFTESRTCKNVTFYTNYANQYIVQTKSPASFPHPPNLPALPIPSRITHSPPSASSSAAQAPQTPPRPQRPSWPPT